MALHYVAHRRYIAAPYPGRVTLFRAQEHPVGCHPEPERGWTGLALGGLEVHEVPGGHSTIINEPYVRVLAEQLRSCLHRARATASGEAVRQDERMRGAGPDPGARTAPPQ